MLGELGKHLFLINRTRSISLDGRTGRLAAGIGLRGARQHRRAEQDSQGAAVHGSTKHSLSPDAWIPRRGPTLLSPTYRGFSAWAITDCRKEATQGVRYQTKIHRVIDHDVTP